MANMERKAKAKGRRKEERNERIQRRNAMHAVVCLFLFTEKVTKAKTSTAAIITDKPIRGSGRSV